MDQVHVIRHKVLVEGLSIRGASRILGVSRNSVRKYLNISEPKRQSATTRRRPVMEVVGPRIDQLLEEWKGRTTAKQRVTASRVHRQLIEEGYQVGSWSVRKYVRERRRASLEVYVPLVHRPGDSAQVDFFEVTVDINGQRRKAWKFLMHFMYSGRDFAWLYDHCDQVSFLDGHIRAFDHFRGVPKRLVYDNLTAAVKRVLRGGRELTDRFKALESHYLFEACFARVGEGHDKGGVESRGKGIRLAHLTPIPQGDGLASISAVLLSDLDREALYKKDASKRTVMDRFSNEQKCLLKVPADPFDPRASQTLPVSSKATVRIRGKDYSVPTRWARLDATTHLGVDSITLVCLGEQVEHCWCREGSRQIDYRHYLPELAKKPQAVRQVAGELIESLGEPYGRLWGLLIQTHGEKQGAQVLSKILAAIVDHGEAPVTEALHRSLASGRTDLLALGAHLRTQAQTFSVAVPERLAQYEIESVSLSHFNTLMTETLS